MTRDADTPIPDLEAEPSGGDPDGAQPEHTPPPAGGSAVRAGGETDNNQPLRHGVAEQTPNLTARDDNTPRSVADQTVPELGGRTSILARQRADHQRLDRLMRRARETAAEAGPAHAVALRAVARLVFTHAFAEEAVLFPAARRSLPEGDPLTLRIETDHQEVDELVTQLDSADPAAADHTELMHRTFAVLDHDVRTEEDELLPRLQQVLGPRRLRLLGWQWELVRRISPTRPHPVVSRRPPGQTLSALPLTVLDRTRDRLQQLDEVTRWRFTAAVSAADRLLAGAAGAVERLPVLRWGERPETSRP